MSRPDDADTAGACSAAAAPQVFIYYRVDAANEAAIRLLVADFQLALCSRFDGLQANLLRRHGGPAEGTLLTLMETYSFNDAGSGQARGVLAELLAAISQAAAPIDPLIDGDRHAEAFQKCV